MKILLVENHSLFATTVVEQFLCSHEVRVVPSVAEGLNALAQVDFDVVLVDYDLDDATGDQLVRTVRTSNVRVPIVAVSARDDGNLAMVDAGADGICRKQGFAHIEHAIASAQKTHRETLLRIQFEVPHAGWVGVRFVVDSEIVELDASFTPWDSLGDLARALPALARSDASATVAFNSEPAETELRLVSDGAHVDLSLTRYPDRLRSRLGKELTRHRAIPKWQALTAFLRAFRALRAATPLDVYQRKWGHPFPWEPVRALDLLIEDKI